MGFKVVYGKRALHAYCSQSTVNISGCRRGCIRETWVCSRPTGRLWCLVLNMTWQDVWCGLRWTETDEAACCLFIISVWKCLFLLTTKGLSQFPETVVGKAGGGKKKKSLMSLLELRLVFSLSSWSCSTKKPSARKYSLIFICRAGTAVNSQQRISKV